MKFSDGELDKVPSESSPMQSMADRTLATALDLPHGVAKVLHD